MVRHVVMFKMKEGVSKQETARVLKSMDGVCPQIREMEVGIDFLQSERSYDVILSVLVDDEVALEAYQNDLYHCNVVKKFMHANRVSSVAVDYYVD
ncbi:MAG TPA: Dabb family protein [Clostridiales bacterium]|nr:Dabb family protein [Clostridiales bacterium]